MNSEGGQDVNKIPIKNENAVAAKAEAEAKTDGSKWSDNKKVTIVAGGQVEDNSQEANEAVEEYSPPRSNKHKTNKIDS